MNIASKSQIVIAVGRGLAPAVYKHQFKGLGGAQNIASESQIVIAVGRGLAPAVNKYQFKG